MEGNLEADEGQGPPPSENLEDSQQLENEAERKLREALMRIDRVDDVQQRFLSEARRQVSELHLEASRARAAALDAARKAVADAEAEAASLLEDAREEAERLRVESEKQVKAHAEVLLAVAHKERDELLSTARAAADRLREEAATAGESLLHTAEAKAVRLVQEAKEEAARVRAEAGAAPAGEGQPEQSQSTPGSSPGGEVNGTTEARQLHDDLRALSELLAQALEALSAHVGADSGAAAVKGQAPEPGQAEEAQPAPVPPAPAPPEPPPGTEPMPLVGSRGSPAIPPRSNLSRDHSSDWPRARRRRGWRDRDS